jgi:hypothetical protein
MTRSHTDRPKIPVAAVATAPDVVTERCGGAPEVGAWRCSCGTDFLRICLGNSVTRASTFPRFSTAVTLWSPQRYCSYNKIQYNITHTHTHTSGTEPQGQEPAGCGLRLQGNKCSKKKKGTLLLGQEPARRGVYTAVAARKRKG